MGLSIEQINEVRAALAKVRTRAPADDLVDAPPLTPLAPAAPPEAPFVVPDDRRRTQRIRRRCNAEISPWLGNRAGTAFSVVLENFSTAGVGILHTDRLKVGAQYLLEIARPGQNPLAVVFTVVRCDETVGGTFNVDLAADEVLEVAVMIADANRPPTRKERVKIVAIVLAFAASAAAVFLNLI
jgi:hypothetical protein